MSDRPKTDDGADAPQGEPTYRDHRDDHLAQRSQWREDQHATPPRPDQLDGDAIRDGEQKTDGRPHKSDDRGDERRH